MALLNDNIKKYRLSMRLNQVEFAKAMNVTKQCVSNWENDNVVPSVDMLVKIADYFRISTDMLLGRSTENVIDANGLTDEQKSHIMLLVADLAMTNKDRNI